MNRFTTDLEDALAGGALLALLAAAFIVALVIGYG